MKKKLLFMGMLSVLSVPLICSQLQRVAKPAEAMFYSDVLHTDRTAYLAKAQKLNIEIADEGAVLLKNQDGALPLANKAAKISIFGKNSDSNKLQMGGGGSGSGSVSQGVTKIDMQKSLQDAGFSVNPNLISFYSNSSKSGSGSTNGNSGWKGISEATVGETPVSSYDNALRASFSEYNDAAVMVIARGGTEGADCKTYDARDNKNDPISEKHYLELSKNENDLLDMIEENFDTVIVVINSGNAFECARLENDDKVSAVIWMGTPGANGAAVIGHFLNGTVCPSGRTVDTWERDFTKNPTFQNFADNSQTNVDPTTKVEYPQDTMFNADGTPVRCDGAYKGAPQWDNQEHKVVKYGLNGVRPSAYVSYEEGVYMDYRFYETAYADKAAIDKAGADEWYAGEEGVIYPFGYGLSYTSFEQEIVSTNVSGKSLKKGNEKVKMTVRVTNTGDVAGKDVVQIYWKAPYYEGGIEKPYEVLCAFAKTKMLEPGESQEVKLDFVVQDLASYDFSDANNNGFKGYELDEGEYTISLNKNAHEVYDEIKCSVPKGGIQYKYDRYTGVEVKNRFSDQDFYSSLPLEKDVGFDQFHRDDLEGTFPSHPTMEDRTLKEGSRVEEFYNHKFTIADLDLNEECDYMPQAAKKTKEDIEALGWKQQPNGQKKSQAESIQFSELMGLDINDPLWEQFMDDMTYDEMKGFIHGGGTHNPAIDRCGKPSTSDSDGPSKFGAMWWCGAPIVAATYNIELAKEQGDCVGIEGHMDNKYGWAGPGVNLHRSPFGGRNFEYYSADPFLTGRISGRVVAGATEKGLYCFFKHFAVNDQEKNREGVTVFLTEQALRELYLKPFQMAVQEGKVTGIMSSYNRLGLMETAASYPLLTEVLRQEWGFKGSIISDMTHRGNSAKDDACYENINNRVLAGCNNQLDSQAYDPDMNCTWDNAANDGKGAPVFTYEGEKYESYSWWYAVRTMAKECLWMCANCGAMQRDFYNDANLEFTGVENGVIEVQVGEKVDIEVKMPENLEVGNLYNGKEITDSFTELDFMTTLPKGLEFVDGHITGVAEEKANIFVKVAVILTLDGQEKETILGSTFELYVVDFAEPGAASNGAAAGGFNAGLVFGIGGGVVAVAAVAVVAVLLLRKKKVQ